ncbi:MAG: TM2 domain-containing protein [Myxococcota bacterium]
MESKSTGVSYILLALSVFGFAGLHRFYLGRPVSGLLYLLTWGFFGVGTFVDIFTLPRLVEEENMRLGFRSLPPGFMGSVQALPPPRSAPPAPSLPPPTTEQSILRLAGQNEGRVTVAMVAMDTGLSLRRAQRELDALVKSGFAEKDVSTEGASLYVFPGLRSNELFDIDKI